MNSQEHLLTCVAEECAEVTKDVSKALRFGLGDHYDKEPMGRDNRERIIDELNDLLGVIDMLVEMGAFPKDWQSLQKQDAKKHRVRKYMGYAAKVGALKVRTDALEYMKQDAFAEHVGQIGL